MLRDFTGASRVRRAFRFTARSADRWDNLPVTEQ